VGAAPRKDIHRSAAAPAIAAEAHAKAIQAGLGHGSIRTTLDLHGYLMPGLDVELADRWDASGSLCGRFAVRI
jgi:hypothetical protein